MSKQPEVFPGKYNRVSPISSGSLAGTQGSVDEDGIYVADAARCFFVTGETKSKGTTLRVKYTGGKTSKVELDILSGSITKVLGELGIDVDVNISKSMELKTGQLVNEVSSLIPNPLAGCDFDKNKEYEVVRQQIRATSLEFTGGISVTGKAGVEVPIEELLKIKAETGWSFTKDKNLVGEDVVLAAKRERVKVVVEAETMSARNINEGVDVISALGFKNETLRAMKLIYRGSATSEDGSPKLHLMPTLAIPSTNVEMVDLPFSVCNFGEVKQLGVGEQCFFLPPPGSTLISFDWTNGVDPASGDTTIKVTISTYRTMEV